MIRCNNCGTMNPDTARNCQNCIAPLPAPLGRGESGVSSRASTQDQPELPAWLESLRAGDRPAAQPKNFSPEDMREEGMVPSWMQPNRPNDERSSNPYSSMRSTTSSAPNTDEGYVPERNISANSLIDANALPSWMQPDKPQPPQQNIAASSLVQPEFMPDWMKTMQPSSQAQAQPSTPMPQQKQSTQPSFPAQGFSAQQLINSQALPSWMQQEGDQKFSPSTTQVGQNGQAGFTASSLLDMNSLPPWMRESEQSGQEQNDVQRQQPNTFQRGNEQQLPWQVPQQSASSPFRQTPQQQPANSPASGSNAPVSSQGGTLSMGSLIDVNSLPEWLRSTAEAQQQSQQGQASSQQQNYATPPRIENVRVPSRPRGEVGTNEGSEVAANVFASMLGVASNAPQYPAQQQPGYPAHPGEQSTSNLAQTLQQPGMPNNAYATGQLGQHNYGQNAQGYFNGMQPGQGNYSGGPIGQQQNRGMIQPPPAQAEKPAKKGGLFEAIRNFFFR